MLFSPRLCRVAATTTALSAIDVRLQDGEALVVCVGLHDPVELPASVLSAAEKRRMARFISARDRQRYFVAHVSKRLLLGWILGQPGASLNFTTGKYGKPALLPAELNFSLSHSGGWIAVGVRRDAPVGIDVQQQRKGVDHAGTVAATAHPADRITATANDSGYPYRLWTIKEAVAKCDGRGLSLGLASLSVRPGDTEGWHICDNGHCRWTVWDIEVAVDTRLAVACPAA